MELCRRCILDRSIDGAIGGVGRGGVDLGGTEFSTGTVIIEVQVKRRGDVGGVVV